MTKATANDTKWFVKSVEIEGLFGKYDFDQISFSKRNSPKTPVSFLYGDNGSGKTTILKIIFALLCQEKHSGVKSYLSRLVFKSVVIKFRNGSVLYARRPAAAKGDFELGYTLADGRENSITTHSSNGRIRLSENPEIDELLNELQEMFPPVVFLNDHRTYKSSLKGQTRRMRSALVAPDFMVADELAEDNAEVPDGSDLEALSKLGLERLLYAARHYISDRALRGTARANQSAGNIYLRIAKQISERARGTKSKVTPREEILARIDALRPQIELFRQFGLREGETVSELAILLQNTKSERVEELTELLDPYVRSVEDRINANQQIVGTVKRYNDAVSFFLGSKNVRVSVGEPIKFFDELNGPIAPRDLSSGERHVLNLCTVALLSTQENSIILIDEPELSLNFKWQKSLVESLLKIAGGTSQYIMASHSFEIMANHVDSIVQLNRRS